MFELFKVGFLTISFTDLIDICIVTFIIYKLYKLLKGTIAAQIFIGLMIILVISFISQAANFKALSWLLKLITDIWVIAFLILFQPEIRRLLVIVARNPFFKMFVKSESSEPASIIADAAFELSQNQHGALMVLIKSDPLFENIREEEHFKQIIETMKNKMNSEREKVLQLTTDENNIIS